MTINPIPPITLEQPRSTQAQITDQVRAQIRAGKWEDGFRLAPTRTLAAAWGTDRATVHRALAALVKEGLLERTPRRGTFVRQREPKLTCVAVLNSATGYGASAYLQALHTALKEELARLDIEMDVWLDPRPDQERGTPWRPLVKAAAHREFQAVIVTNTGVPLLQWQQRLPVPVAFHASTDSYVPIPSAVQHDVKQFAELSLRALARQGCRSVGLIFPQSPATAPTQTRPNRWGEFAEHFVGLARDLGLTVRNQWMHLPLRVDALQGRSQESYGYECFRDIWDRPERPAGLVVYPDTVARGVILAARERQVCVPADLKLVLHKNEAIELLCPMPATFVVSSERAIARALIAQVQKQLRGEPCQPIDVPFRLEARRRRNQC